MFLKRLSLRPIMYWYKPDPQHPYNYVRAVKLCEGEIAVYVGNRCVFRTALADDCSRGHRASISIVEDGINNVDQKMIDEVIAPCTDTEIYKHTMLTPLEIYESPAKK